MQLESSNAAQCCVHLAGMQPGPLTCSADPHVRVKGLSWVQQCIVFLATPWPDLLLRGPPALQL